MHHPRCVISNQGEGGVRQNTTVLYPIYFADDDMFRSLCAIFRSQKYIYRKTIQSLLIVLVHIVSFQRDLVVGWIIHIELKVPLLSSV